MNSHYLHGTTIALILTLAGAASAAPEQLVKDGQKRTIADWTKPGMISSPVSFVLDFHGNLYLAETQRAGNAVSDTRNIMHLNAVEEDLQFKSIDDRLKQINKWTANGDFPPGFFTKTEDSIRVVRDTDGDGLADTQSVFAGGFNEPLDGIGSGLLWHNGSLYYTCIPHLWKLTPGADPYAADKREKLASGFGVRWCFYGHDLHGLTPGPDGRLYFSMGDRGFNVVTKEGKNLVGVDRGGVFRCWPDGSELELYYQGLRNPQELAFDEQGELFTGDNNCDSGDKARVVHIVEGGDSGWRQDVQSLDSRGPWNREFMWKTLKDVPMGPARPAWSLPPVEYMCDGPSGILMYPGIGEDHRYDGHLFLVDFYGSGAKIHSFKCVPEGAGFKIDDHTEYYRGLTVTDIAFGYDGRMYASDWGGGWSPNPNGKVFTITNDTVRQDPAEVKAIAELKAIFEQGFDKRKSEELLTFLGHRDQRVRLYSQFELANRGEASVAPLGKIAETPTGSMHARLHALWCLGQIGHSSKSATAKLMTLTQDGDPEIRAQAIRTLGDLRKNDIGLRALSLLEDPSARVRLYAAQALGRIGFEPAIGPLLKVLNDTGTSDLTLRHGAAHALAGMKNPTAVLAALKNVKGDSTGARMGVLISLRELGDARVGEFLNDSDAAIVAEAVRGVYDLRIQSHMAKLASLLDGEVPAGAAIEPVIRRVIEANVLLGDDLSAARLARCAANSKLDVEWRSLAAERLLGWDKRLKREGVWGDWADYPPRNEAALKALLPTAMPAIMAAAGNEKELLPKAQALEARYTMTSEDLVKKLTSAATPLEHKTVLLDDLASRESVLLLPACKALLASEASTGKLRSHAEELWAKAEPASAAAYLAEAAGKGTVNERQNSIRILGTIDDPQALTALKGLASRMEKGTLDPEISLDVYEAAQSKLPDGPTKDALRSLSQQGTRPSGFSTMFLKAGGDAARGKQIFLHNAQSECVRCHTVDGQGGNAGPNLSAVAMRASVEKLVESVVEPGAVIAPGFGSVTAMPDMTKYLKPRQVRDVVAFLGTLKTPPKGGTPVPAEVQKAVSAEANSGGNDVLKLALIGALLVVAGSVWRSISRRV